MNPTRGEIISVIREFQQRGPKAFERDYGYRQSTKYDLLYQGHRYPPKAIYNVARKRALREDDKTGDSRGLPGGRPVNVPLARLNFQVVLKKEQGLDEPDAAADDIAQRSIALRRGQAKFKSLLLAAYGSACAITGCGIGAILEACHIKPYSDFKDYSIKNGLLLRSDIHTRFDLNLIKLDPDNMHICVDRSITDPNYRSLHGNRVRLPERRNEQPEQMFLMIRWKQPA